MSEKPAAQALIGATLLVAGRPVRLAELAQVLGADETLAAEAVQGFTAALKAAQLGFTVEVVAGGFRLVVPPETASYLAPVLAPPPIAALSQAALEVLAVIAYRQPITRAEIEAMRGASAGTVVTLQERELIKVTGRSQAVGQPLLYGTTDKFLLEFGLASLSDLPPLQGADFAHLLRG